MMIEMELKNNAIITGTKAPINVRVNGTTPIINLENSFLKTSRCNYYFCVILFYKSIFLASVSATCWRNRLNRRGSNKSVWFYSISLK